MKRNASDIFKRMRQENKKIDELEERSSVGSVERVKHESEIDEYQEHLYSLFGEMRTESLAKGSIGSLPPIFEERLKAQSQLHKKYPDLLPETAHLAGSLIVRARRSGRNLSDEEAVKRAKNFISNLIVTGEVKSNLIMDTPQGPKNLLNMKEVEKLHRLSNMFLVGRETDKYMEMLKPFIKVNRKTLGGR